MATHVEGLTGPVFAERAMWWGGPGGAGWVEGHAESAARQGHARWALAYVPESATIAILNTGSEGGQAKITLFSKNGIGAAERVIAVPPGLTTFRPTELWPALGPDRYGATVESLSVGGAAPAHIVVERTSYARGMTAGTSSLGTPIP